MKAKHYWEQQERIGHPFDLPQRISEGIDACRKNVEGKSADSATVRYIWIYLTDDGLRHGHGGHDDQPELNLDDWLNIIDESAALGAEWMVVYVGASLSHAPLIWRMCSWAQEVHDLNVGLHLTSNCLSEDDIERLMRLDRERTFLVADETAVSSLRFLEERGLHVCQSDLHLDEGVTRCNKPANIACVGPNGQLFSCGLVLGEQEYALGDVRDKRLSDVLRDESLPHTIEDTSRFPEHGCDACPPLMVEQIRRRDGG